MTSKQEKAKKDYLAGAKYKEIAEKYGVSVSAVKSWKARYWGDATEPKKVATRTQKVATKKKKVATIYEIKGDNLTSSQELFAQLVGGKRLPLYRAYEIAFNQTNKQPGTLMAAASRLAKEPKIKARIVKISEEVATNYEWSLEKVVQSLTFVHDEAKADVYEWGVKKANTDAMLNSLDRITELLGISNDSKSAYDAEIAKHKARIAKVEADDAENIGATNPLIEALTNNLQALHPETKELDDEDVDH